MNPCLFQSPAGAAWTFEPFRIPVLATLYTAPSRSFGARWFHRLGLTDSRGSHPLGYPMFGLCLASTCAPIIADQDLLVKGFLRIFFADPRTSYSGEAPREGLRTTTLASPCSALVRRPSEGLGFASPPDTVILSHYRAKVNTFSKIYRKNFRGGLAGQSSIQYRPKRVTTRPAIAPYIHPVPTQIHRRKDIQKMPNPIFATIFSICSPLYPKNESFDLVCLFARVLLIVPSIIEPQLAIYSSNSDPSIFVQVSGEIVHSSNQLHGVYLPFLFYGYYTTGFSVCQILFSGLILAQAIRARVFSLVSSAPSNLT